MFTLAEALNGLLIFAYEICLKPAFSSEEELRGFRRWQHCGKLGKAAEPREAGAALSWGWGE